MRIQVFFGGLLLSIILLAINTRLLPINSGRLSGGWKSLLQLASVCGQLPASANGEDGKSCASASCNNASHFDALVVAGGGQTAMGPPPHVVLRLEKALEM